MSKLSQLPLLERIKIWGGPNILLEAHDAIEVLEEENERLTAEVTRTQAALDSYMDAYQNMRQFAIDSGLDVTTYHGPTRLTLPPLPDPNQVVECELHSFQGIGHEACPWCEAGLAKKEYAAVQRAYGRQLTKASHALANLDQARKELLESEDIDEAIAQIDTAMYELALSEDRAPSETPSGSHKP